MTFSRPCLIHTQLETRLKADWPKAAGLGQSFGPVLIKLLISMLYNANAMQCQCLCQKRGKEETGRHSEEGGNKMTGKVLLKVVPRAAGSYGRQLKMLPNY